MFSPIWALWTSCPSHRLLLVSKWLMGRNRLHLKSPLLLHAVTAVDKWVNDTSWDPQPGYSLWAVGVPHQEATADQSPWPSSIPRNGLTKWIVYPVSTKPHIQKTAWNGPFSNQMFSCHLAKCWKLWNSWVPNKPLSFSTFPNVLFQNSIQRTRGGKKIPQETQVLTLNTWAQEAMIQVETNIVFARWRLSNKWAHKYVYVKWVINKACISHWVHSHPQQAVTCSRESHRRGQGPSLSTSSRRFGSVLWAVWFSNETQRKLLMYIG